MKRAIVQAIAQGWGRQAYGRGKVDVEGGGVKDDQQKTRRREDEKTSWDVPCDD